MKRVCVVITARASYARVLTVLEHLRDDPAVELQIVLTASALLGQHGNVAAMCAADGFAVKATTTVRSMPGVGTSALMVELMAETLKDLPAIFARLRPDVVVTIADRFETLATAIAARYCNIPLAHLQGGEVTGNIDDEVRRAITQLAQVHCVATDAARENVQQQRQLVTQYGEAEPCDDVVVTGCPSIDLALRAAKLPDPCPNLCKKFGAIGPTLDLSGDFLMVLQHPVTNEQSETRAQIQATLDAVERSGIPALWFWPNADAGTDTVLETLQAFDNLHKDALINFLPHLPPMTFLRLMACPGAIMVGNSSAAIREGSALGTRAVNVGTRQNGRERSADVRECPNDSRAILDCIEYIALNCPHGFQKSDLYGDGHAGEKIARLLAR